MGVGKTMATNRHSMHRGMGRKLTADGADNADEEAKGGEWGQDVNHGRHEVHENGKGRRDREGFNR